MRSIGWLGIVGLICFGCSNATTSGQVPDGGGGGGGGSGGPSAHILPSHLSGAGTVQSATPSFSCHADCQETVAGGTVVLAATADANSTFAGWQGDCTGTGGCSLGMGAEQNAPPLFPPNQPPPPPGPFQAPAIPAGNGAGRITSSPAGIDCPGHCSMNAQN